MEMGYPHQSLFPYGEHETQIPVSIWGSPYRNGSLFPNGDGSVTNPFPNRVHAHLGIEVKITIWECFPYGDHRFHMVITTRKWAGRLEYSHMGNPRFRIEFVSIWGLTYMPRALALRISSSTYVVVAAVINSSCACARWLMDSSCTCALSLRIMRVRIRQQGY